MSLASMPASLTARIISSGTCAEKTVTSARHAVRMLLCSSPSLSSSSLLSICMSMFVPDSPPLPHNVHCALDNCIFRTLHRHRYVNVCGPLIVDMWCCERGRRRCNNLCAPVQSSSSRIAMCVPSYSTADRGDEYNVKTNNSSWSKTTKL
jgi:hypothetical protein